MRPADEPQSRLPTARRSAEPTRTPPCARAGRNHTEHVTELNLTLQARARSRRTGPWGPGSRPALAHVWAASTAQPDTVTTCYRPALRYETRNVISVDSPTRSHTGRLNQTGACQRTPLHASSPASSQPCRREHPWSSTTCLIVLFDGAPHGGCYPVTDLLRSGTMIFQLYRGLTPSLTSARTPKSIPCISTRLYDASTRLGAGRCGGGPSALSLDF